MRGDVTVEVTVSAGPAIQKLTVTATQTEKSIGPLPVAVVLSDGVYRATGVNLPPTDPGRSPSPSRPRSST